MPRYTSYPTAVQFAPFDGASPLVSWLADLHVREKVSLYVHIPFCTRLCWYCGCHTSIVRSHEPVAAYLASLRREIETISRLLPGRMPVSAIHFGGGTPNMLSPADLRLLFRTLHEQFDILPDAEIAAEIDPRILSREWVKAARGQGLNRASIGVQDLDPAVQAAINRVQPFEQVSAAFTWLREAGVASVNVDLLYGLPRQTEAAIANTIERMCTLVPDRIALFGYAHVPWMKPSQKLLLDSELPDTEERFTQQALAASHLEAAGYRRIGLDHFALPTDPLAQRQASFGLHRNFQGYTTDDACALLGFGASAISRLPQGYCQNNPAIDAWMEAAGNGGLTATRGVALTDDDRLRAAIIENIMCSLAADISAIAQSQGAEATMILSEAARAKLRDMEEDGIVVAERDECGCLARLTVTEAGRPFVRNVCALFDAYLDAQARRHSASI